MFSHYDDNEQWAPVSDLMAVLMLMFMFIVVVWIRVEADAASAQETVREQEGVIRSQAERIRTQNEQLRQAEKVRLQNRQLSRHAEIFQAECDKIYYELRDEFRSDFAVWQAELLPNLAIRFNNPGVLFDKSESEPNQEFKTMLSAFFPRYMRSIGDYYGDIQEIRIEGHTSSEWEETSDPKIAYMKNMKLSQDRARLILQYVMFELPGSDEYNGWARPLVIANGLSSSKLIFKDDGIGEDADKSRRVEFRLLVKSCLKAE